MSIDPGVGQVAHSFQIPSGREREKKITCHLVVITFYFLKYRDMLYDDHDITVIYYLSAEKS